MIGMTIEPTVMDSVTFEAAARKITSRCGFSGGGFSGGCINDTVIHLATTAKRDLTPFPMIKVS